MSITYHIALRVCVCICAHAETLSTDGGPMEGQPEKEHGERAPGRADERAIEGG